MKKKIAFQTFGCKLNFAETSAIARKFPETEYETVEFGESADYYVIHSCTVTGHAEKKTRAAIRQAMRKNPEASVAVIGCYSQLRPEEIRKIKGVEIVLGNNDKYRLPEYIDTLGKEKTAGVTEIKKPETFEPDFSAGDRTRAFFKVQDGCDYFCTFCAIPYARGRSRSASVAETLNVARQIAHSDVREIVLTGVNIGDFGRHRNESFFDLLKGLETMEGIDRIRISSVEPELLNHGIIELVAGSRKYMPHFHIPLQSGTDRILELMKRKYKREVFEERVHTIKKLMPHACIAADVITGFPGETDEDFNQTRDFIESLPVSYLHVFTYSTRPGTLASRMEDQVPDRVKQERSRILHALSDTKKDAFYAEHINSVQEVLWESDNENGFMTGFTGNYIRCKKQWDAASVNTIERVILVSTDTDGIYYTKPYST
ncbi:MAG TPA: tRNA (N(6)-L-threonylcarbamoyladenosine(37)-C(2))-methylthiotransferase MtaB [Lentimicrobium sp.]|jgi:threonylcarbamoyladenosine tRNA methylthiotransferase MtaB|nr:tRNA (N(6)-L-threonylcarbamoyladenosine(37)-C(2))-methylthiotransferase MtaB [Lentimicrobium sp.]